MQFLTALFLQAPSEAFVIGVISEDGAQQLLLDRKLTFGQGVALMAHSNFDPFVREIYVQLLSMIRDLMPCA